MTTCPIITGLLATTIALATAAHAGAIKLPQPTHSILALTISRGDCPWSGMTDSYEQEQSNKYVKAVALDGVTNGALPSLAEFDKPDVLMVRNTAQTNVAVNSRYFSDLRRGDATRLGMGQAHRVGVFRDLTFARLKPRDLVMFLVKSQLIETYWHLEAQLKMLREEDRPDAYQAWFHGVHTYFTNDQHDETFAFTVTVDKKTGEMTLTGGDVLDVRGPPGK